MPDFHFLLQGLTKVCFKFAFNVMKTHLMIRISTFAWEDTKSDGQIKTFDLQMCLHLALLYTFAMYLLNSS